MATFKGKTSLFVFLGMVIVSVVIIEISSFRVLCLTPILTTVAVAPLKPTESISTEYTDQQFWNNATFNASLHLQTLSKEFGDSKKDKDIYEMCKKIMTHYDNPGNAAPKWSQAYQEYTLFYNFFHGKTNGIYLDIAARVPFINSNSAFFDICLGWSGVCVEPTHTSLQFKGNRSCTMANKCVSSKTQNFSFKFEGGLSRKIGKDSQSINESNNEFECQALSAQDLLNGYKAQNKYNELSDLAFGGNESNVIEIDYISLDIEGSELEFLKCFPFERYDVKVWTVEINRNAQNIISIDEIMYHNGYIKYDYLPLWSYALDGVYVKPPHWKYLQRPLDKWSHYTKCETD